MHRILFLTAWYPNRYDSMFGLFVRKHAFAAGIYNDVTVIYAHADKNIKKSEYFSDKKENITEIVVYYPAGRPGLLGKFIKLFRYFYVLHRAYQMYVNTGGKPDLIHVNILTRTGIPALLKKLTQGIPYVVTEHWTRYLPENDTFNGILRKIATKIIAKNASVVMPVSEQLQKAMLKHHLSNNRYQIVNNVVDDMFYETSLVRQKQEITQILLVSCFLERAKNVKGILNTIKSLSERRQDFKLTVVGTGPDYEMIINYLSILNISDELIDFVGEKQPDEVTTYFSKADFFILFSNYETFGIVIAESLASGVPIISTKTGIATDYIQSDNGILVDIGNENEFEQAIDYMLDHCQEYKREKIRESGRIFSFETIGKTYTNIYNSILKL
jgi:glycosyltransferase involved in cell wall biosynthesis